MPYCGNCGAQVNESANFCMKCGTPRKKITPQVATNPVPTENEMAREKSANSKTSNDFIDNTICSPIPLNWKNFPNLIFIENAFPTEMADNIAAFIKRTRDSVKEYDFYIMRLVNLDPARSWSSLEDSDMVTIYYDIEKVVSDFAYFNGTCLGYQKALAEKRLSNTDEYNKAFPYSPLPHYFIIIDDYDSFIHRANDNRLQNDWLPNMVSCANRIGFHLIFCSRSGPQILGNLKNSFTVFRPSEFAQMCKVGCPTNTAVNSTNHVPTENETARENSAYSRTSDDFVDNTNCSTLPLNWKKWPNLMLIENAYPPEMADSIEAFIKRTKDDDSIDNSYFLYLVNLDPARSWSSILVYNKVTFYHDEVEDGVSELYGLYGLCLAELESLAEKRVNNIDEYNRAFPEDYYPHHFFFIDDYDTFIQRANNKRLQNELLPYIVSYANRLGVHLIFGSRSGPRILGKLKNAFTVKSSSEFDRMCKGEYSTNTTVNSTVTGYDFEQYCAGLLSKNSFINVKVTKKSGDQGIDILAEKDYVKYAIQCKYYTSSVGNNAVQEAFAGKSYYGCHVAVVMTNNTFTDSARQLASQLGVVLWDGSFISELQKAN